MHKYDEFVKQQLISHLNPGEEIEVTGFLYTKSLAVAVLVGALSLMGEGYFFAALTKKHLFLIATEMGFASLKMMNKKLVKLPYDGIAFIQTGGLLNQKKLTLTLKSGEVLVFRLNTLATSYASGQKIFINNLVGFHNLANS